MNEHDDNDDIDDKSDGQPELTQEQIDEQQLDEDIVTIILPTINNS